VLGESVASPRIVITVNEMRTLIRGLIDASASTTDVALQGGCADTDPSALPGRIAPDKREICNIPRDHSPRCHQGERADRDSGQDDGAGADRCMSLDRGRGIRGDLASRTWVRIVRENGSRSDKNTAGDVDAVPNRYSTLYRDSVTQNRAAFDKNAITDLTVAADSGAREEIAESPNSRTRADLVRCDEGRVVDEDVGIPIVLH
jgi:hypothetical protein